jgi:ectoine hydroxylase-related dioxygenase (phytanoyl-CoA dioxygenase family)
MWVPLSDATTDNGCIHVIPAYLDADYTARRFQHIRPDAALVRALPATAGSVLLWNQCLIHWGGRSSVHAGQPRVSLGLELQRADARAFDLPLVPSLSMPPLERRLAYIGKSIYTYFGRTALPMSYGDIAVHLAQVIG